MRSPVTFCVMKYKNCSMKSKIFFSYFVLIFIPLVILSLLSFQKSAAVITNQSMDIASLYLTQTEGLLQAELSKMSDISQMISQRADIRRILEKRGPLNFSEEFDDMDGLYKSIVNTRSLYNIYQVRLYISDQFFYSRSNYITFNIEDIKGESWYRQMLEERKNQALVPPYTFRSPLEESQELISVVTLIRSYENINEILGVVSVDIPVKSIAGILKTGDFTGNGKIILTNGADEVVSYCAPDSPLVQESFQPQLTEMIGKYPDSSGIAVSSTAVTGVSAPIFDGWRLFTAASFQSIMAESSRLGEQLILLTGIVGVIVYFLAYFCSRSNTKRIQILAEQIKNVEKGNLHVNCVVDSEDEIGELQNSFNFMVRKINALMGERYNLGKNLKGMELKALQAQINPHFLYNTLDLISWKAKKSGSPEIVDIVYKLARFYQISLSNGSDFIALKDEAEHIRLYAALQNLRSSQAIRLETEIDPTVEDCPIMKLILQPIVENSISHGIMNLDGGGGVIRLSAQADGDYIQIEIRDNGVGVEKSKLVGILSHERSRVLSNKSGGYGLYNIIDRLKIYYNDDYFFDILSTPGQGTTVIIRIPMNRGQTPKIHFEREFRQFSQREEGP